MRFAGQWNGSTHRQTGPTSRDATASSGQPAPTVRAGARFSSSSRVANRPATTAPSSAATETARPSFCEAVSRPDHEEVAVCPASGSSGAVGRSRPTGTAIAATKTRTALAPTATASGTSTWR